MRWLWQFGGRWIAGKLWQHATARGTKHEPTEPQPVPDEIEGPAEPIRTLPCVVAIVCSSKKLMEAVVEGMRRKKRFEANGFAVCVAKCGDASVVVARRVSDDLPVEQMIAALADAHSPKLILSAAEGESLHESVAPGEIVVAKRLLRASGAPLDLGTQAIQAAGVHFGDVAPAAAGGASELVLAADALSLPVAEACQKAGVPLLATTAVLVPCPSARSKEVDALDKQKSLAGRAGVLTGMLFKKRSGLKDLWDKEKSEWQAHDRLVSLVKFVVGSM